MVLPHERERRRGDRDRSTPSPVAIPCTSVVLPAPSSPVRITASRGRSSVGERFADRSGLLGGRGPELEAHQNSSSCSSPERTGYATVDDGQAASAGEVARRRSSQRPPDQQEVVAESLRTGSTLAAAAQDRRRVERGDHASGRATRGRCPRSRVIPARGLQDELRREVPERDDHDGWMIEICSTSHGVHASISSGSGSRLPGRAALQDVRDVHVLARSPISPSMRVSS